LFSAPILTLLKASAAVSVIPHVIPIAMPPVERDRSLPPTNVKIGQTFDLNALEDPSDEQSKPKHHKNSDDYFGMNIKEELAPLNDAIESLSYNQLNELLAAQNFATSPLAQSVISKLALKVGNKVIADKILKKWQTARKEAKEEEGQVQEEAQARGKKIRLLIKCANCGRPFCKVAPYMESRSCRYVK